MRLAAVLTAALLVAAAPAMADDEQVLQIKQAFEPAVLTVAAGASVSFVNADDVNHNLQQTGPDGVRKDLGVSKPGETVSMSFAGAGLYLVNCQIHPRMKLKVTVK